jgi:diadenosine tetraphosphate (Ap4A) HIT family hydrolase
MIMHTSRKEGCPHCKLVEQAAAGGLVAKVFETEHVLVIAGDHQYFPGYCVVISKTHVREMHHLPTDMATKIFADVLDVGRTIEGAFNCHKMNYVSLGNVVEHLHWHVMPRYEDDPDHKDHPWKNAARFADRPTTDGAIKKLREAFNRKKF